MIAISVIIPIYNAEAYIERCVRSLMEQTMQNIEYIFINDCSTDNSIEILNKTLAEYSHQNKSISILHNQKNSGPSESRKRGFYVAQGEYICCCDSDDWIDPKMYETMYKSTNNGKIDIVVCDYTLEFHKTNIIKKMECFHTPQEALANLDNSCKFSYSMCNQLIRKSLILQEYIHIDSIRYREDTFLLMRIYYYAQSISYIPIAYYHYWKENLESLTHNIYKTKQEWIKQKRNFDKIVKLLYSKDNDYERYHWGVNKFKYSMKKEYKECFYNLYEYYKTYKESHYDIIYLNNQSCKSRIKQIKTKLVYNFFICFWLYSLRNNI